MRGSKFTDSLTTFIIKQGEARIPVAEICRIAGISQATHFDWKKRYGGLMPSGMRRLKELEEKNEPDAAVAQVRLDTQKSLASLFSVPEKINRERVRVVSAVLDAIEIIPPSLRGALIAHW